MFPLILFLHIFLLLFLLNFCSRLNLLSAYSTVSKRFKMDINVVHIRDLNFVLCLEIFVHYDEQLRATHLILGYVPWFPSYTSYRDPRLALAVGSPLLSYIDVRLPGLLLKGLIMWEAREKGPCHRRESSLDLVKDGSGDTVFQGRAEHIPVEEPTILAPNAIMVQ